MLVKLIRHNSEGAQLQ